MAVPKRRHSKTRTRKRRSHQGLRAPGFSECSTCHMPTLPHRVCAHCGSYNGVEVVKVKTGTGT